MGVEVEEGEDSNPNAAGTNDDVERNQPDEIEANPFIDYVCDIFDDDAPQTMQEIFGDDKHL